MNYIFILINFFVLLNCKLIDNSPITIKVEYYRDTFIGNDGGLVILEKLMMGPKYLIIRI